MNGEPSIRVVYTPKWEDFEWLFKGLEDQFTLYGLFETPKRKKAYKWAIRGFKYLILILFALASDAFMRPLFSLAVAYAFVYFNQDLFFFLFLKQREQGLERYLFDLPDGIQTVDFSSTGVRMEGSNIQINYPWALILNHRENDTMFMFQFRPESVKFIPKRAMSKQQISELRVILQTVSPV